MPAARQVIITGSSRGLGLSLARQFLLLGDDVMLSSRTAAALEAAARQLRTVRPRGSCYWCWLQEEGLGGSTKESLPCPPLFGTLQIKSTFLSFYALAALQEFPERKVVAVPCDVSQPQDVWALVGKAAEELGRIVRLGFKLVCVFVVAAVPRIGMGVWRAGCRFHWRARRGGKPAYTRQWRMVFRLAAIFMRRICQASPYPHRTSWSAMLPCLPRPRPPPPPATARSRRPSWLPPWAARCCAPARPWRACSASPGAARSSLWMGPAGAGRLCL